jgi:simple sugar transport system permease protein
MKFSIPIGERHLEVEKRLTAPWWKLLVVNLVAVALAVVTGAAFLALTGHNPFEVYSLMLAGAFGSRYAVSETLVKAIPLLLCGLGVGAAFRMKLWNIGAEGQLYMGGLAAAAVAFAFPELPTGAMLPLMFAAGMLGGGLWAMLAAVPRAMLGVNETLTTLMLNYVGVLTADWLVHGRWKDPAALNFPLSPEFVTAAWLPVLPGSRVHAGLLIGLVFAVMLWFVYRHSKWGYETAVIGESPETARYAGIPVRRNIILVMLLSGALAGLAGMTELAGVIHRVQPNFSPGYGYTAIIVAWLSRLNPLLIVPVAVLMAALLVGGFAVQTSGLPAATASMLQGAILFFVLGSDIFLNYRFVWRKHKGGHADD